MTVSTTTQNATRTGSAPSLRTWQMRAWRRVDYTPDEQLTTAGMLKRNLRISAAYAELYLRHPDLYKWAGMAALTSATVGKAMYMMLAARYTGLGLLAGLLGRDAETIFAQLVYGNWLVFDDIYWQHLAYEQGGLAALEAIHSASPLAPQLIEGWRQVDAGRRESNTELIWQGNTTLLQYEQEQVLQPGVYEQLKPLWSAVAGWVPSPVPGHLEMFGDHRRGGNIGEFAQRWGWITGTMLPRYRQLAEASPARVQRELMGCVRLSTWIAMAERPGHQRMTALRGMLGAALA
jgi:hypothetical protein